MNNPRIDEQFNLSNKINNCRKDGSKRCSDSCIDIKDVKEFIRLLKEINFTKRKHNIINSIDKLAGDKLK